MNERIKELVKQATSYTWNGNDVTEELDEQKFAELIVRECARALDDKLANPNGASIAYCDGSDLLEHFGVEE
jgi:hypothetical protein